MKKDVSYLVDHVADLVVTEVPIRSGDDALSERRITLPNLVALRDQAQERYGDILRGLEAVTEERQRLLVLEALQDCAAPECVVRFQEALASSRDEEKFCAWIALGRARSPRLLGLLQQMDLSLLPWRGRYFAGVAMLFLQQMSGLMILLEMLRLEEASNEGRNGQELFAPRIRALLNAIFPKLSKDSSIEVFDRIIRSTRRVPDLGALPRHLRYLTDYRHPMETV